MGSSPTARTIDFVKMILNKLAQYIFIIIFFFFNNLIANELDEKIKNFILKNPEVIIESLNNFEKQKEDEKKIKIKESVKTNKDLIFDANTLLYEGNKLSKNIIVEFFDYNCSYCRRVHKDLKKTLKNSKDVKIIYKNFPILSDNSLKLAKFAIIISEIDSKKFVDFHNSIMNIKGQVNEDDLNEVIKKLNIDLDLVKSMMNNEEVEAKLRKDIDLANKLGLRGTPAFVIGDELIFGYINHEEIISKLF